MSNQTEKSNMNQSYRIITLILNDSQCVKFNAIAHEKHICDGIIMPGKGTVKNTALNILGIKSQKITLINVLLEEEKAIEVLERLTEKLRLKEPNHGLAFTTTVRVAGNVCAGNHETLSDESDMEEESMFKKLTVVVNRGAADDVMDIARRSGVKGGTILHGRGTGAECAAKLFGMEIEPEKELVLILMPSEIVDKVIEDLYRELKLDVPGNGILFVEPVWDVRGLFEDIKE